MDGECDPILLHDYLLNDLQLGNCHPKDPEANRIYRSQWEIILGRIRGIYRPHFSGDPLRVIVTRTSGSFWCKHNVWGTTDLNAEDATELRAEQRFRLLPLLWRSDLEDHSERDAHLALLALDMRDHRFIVWDPSGSTGLSDPMVVHNGLGLQWEEVQMLHTPSRIKSETPQPLQGILEYYGPKEGLCAITSTLVFLCALRFHHLNVQELSSQIVDLLLCMRVSDRQNVARNTVSLYRRLYTMGHHVEDVAVLLGIYHPGNERWPRACGFMQFDPAAGRHVHCREPSRTDMVYCEAHVTVALDLP